MTVSTELVRAVGVAALVAVASVAPAQAQSEDEVAEARRSFELGTSAYEVGRFEEALAHFEHAYGLTGSPELLYNIAAVADRLRRDEHAVHVYERYLSEVPDASDRAHVEARIASLRASIARDRGRNADESRVHIVIDEPHPTARPPYFGIGLTIGGGVVAAAGGVLLALGVGDIQAIEGAAPGTRWETVADGHGRGPVLATTGVALLLVGVGVAATGVVLVLTRDEEREVAVAFAPSGLALAGRFR